MSRFRDVGVFSKADIPRGALEFVKYMDLGLIQVETLHIVDH